MAKGSFMKKILIVAAAAAALTSGALAPLPAQANKIERACMKSDRKAANRQLCGCIQQVADMTLKSRDQSKAAKFFEDPHKAQELRQADGRANEAFWQRYKAFGATAEQFCS